MTIQHFFAFAAATLAFGFTATAQTTTYPIGCPQPITYVGFTTEIRVAATKATNICSDTVGKRLDARVKFYQAESHLMGVALFEGSTAGDIERAVNYYQDMLAVIRAADKQLVDQLQKVRDLYYDWLVDRMQAGVRFDEDAQNAFWPWNTAAQDVVRLPELSEPLIKSAAKKFCAYGSKLGADGYCSNGMEPTSPKPTKKQ